nr:radical SAM protein [Candidatus Omnitrophota bacterium]
MNNFRLKYKEKISSLSFFHLLRLAKTIFKSPRGSINNGIIKVMFNLTYRCQCSCDYCWCSRYEKNTTEELSLAEVKRTVDQIAQRSSLFTLVSFVGGEPLLREDIYQIVKYATKRGLFVEMETNGVLLSESCVLKLKSSGLNHIFVRIEGSDETAHDSVSHCPGCFKLAIEGIRRCLRAGLSCSIFANASREKIRNGQVERIIDLAKRLRVNSVRVIYPTLAGGWINAENQRLSAEEEAKVAALLEPGFVYLESTGSCSKGSSRSCAALQKKFFHISCYGEIQPCPFVPLSFGNIRQRDLNEIVNGMFRHPVFYEGYNNCLMNDPDFRRKYILPAELWACYRNIVL